MPGDIREAREALRSLLLPINADEEQEALAAAIQAAENEGTEPSDFAQLIHYETESWRNTGTPPTLLKKILKAFISTQSNTHASQLADEYFSLHKELQKDGYLLSFDQSSALLSHCILMINLAYESKLSASQISRILSDYDQRVPFSRDCLELTLKKLNLNVDITEEEIITLFNQDAELSIELLADAELTECSKLVAEVADKVGLKLDTNNLLNILTPPTEISKYTPYLQMLHYQCSIMEFFDFACRDLYEFNPRGVAPNALFEKYPDTLDPAGNPFLNNAKSVEQITMSWARSKKRTGKYPGASALYLLLDGLESLGFTARRELSFWIRLWLHRIILLHSQEPTQLPSPITEAQATLLINFVNTANTESSGVIEQRIVDAGAKVYYPNQATWKPKGLKDSVNTTNISRKKLGDCDFQNSEEHSVIAYEAHGGKLTDIYFKEHIRTLKKILPHRITEWESFSTVSDWSVKVIFVAHEIALEKETVIFDHQGVSVTIEATTFTEFLGQCDLSELTNSIGEYVMETLSETRVPESIRKKVSDIITP
jgi:hypothetical protein